MKSTIALAVVLAAGLAATLSAEEGKPPQFDAARAMAEVQKQMLARFDLNKDGVLSDQEKLAAMEAVRRQGGAAGLGLVPGGFPGAEQFLKQFDKDGDGNLSDAEKLAASAAFQKLRAGGEGGGVQRGPGVGEVPAGGTNVPLSGQGEGKPMKTSALVKRFDKDGDGKLNDEEKATLQAELGKKKGKIVTTKEKPAKPAEKP